MQISKTTLIGWIAGGVSVVDAIYNAYSTGKLTGETGIQLGLSIAFIIICHLTSDGVLTIFTKPVAKQTLQVAGEVVGLESAAHPTNKALAAINDGIKDLTAVVTAQQSAAAANSAPGASAK